jgi:preprotein translocase subunit SecF
MRFDSIGPIIGQELRSKSIMALIIVFILIVIYISIAFRKMSAVLSPWTLGGAALVALFHDIAVPLGIFSVLGYLYGIEISAVFVAAVLTILGYSVSDSVVVFDRIRENVIKYGKDNFGQLVHRSVMQTLSRSINTSLTTILSLLAIYFFGGESTKMFSLALIIGVFLGTYSSIFVASPILVWLSRKRAT